ncbi:LysM peptidoglycan-binding domain-containing protein [Cytobacillus oceanisediminis]|uniref:LysM peptidoglycan-binding domain-containing protein n=1 Tax=Cytobacillus oceanisediminis TaxID=665099 RepID=UPI002041E103|nr:LysM peptidoglycan-binding domain-containing protein [Cytobacillus oceanisediminis]MCM3401897.1 LysM peptidoglycan-binding domain-containing protein [Cytobacillus oceanisediminis]MDK7664547.1 LysM peptidoglycan-binding domain-containing protein [Cytobacillus oceanisediminis]
MNKEDPYRDQAERLRKKIDRKQEAEYSGQKSALPPRSRVHQEKRKKSKWKVKYPVIRLLALFFILLPITIFSIYQYVSSDKNINAGLNAEIEETGSETVVFATNDEDEGTAIEVREEPESQEPEKPEKAEGVQVKEDAKVQQEKHASQTTAKEDKGSEPNSKKQAQQTAPESTDSSKTAGKQEQEELKTEGKVVYHTVKPKETIFRIAMTYYKSQSGIEKIKQANNLPSNEIQTGQVLKIPLEQ